MNLTDTYGKEYFDQCKWYYEDDAAYNNLVDMVALFNPKAVIDVGCGPGTLLSEAKKRNYLVFGIEPNKRCHKLLEEAGIDYTGDFFPLKQDPGKRFDCVFLLNTLEHTPNPLPIWLCR